MSLFGQYLVDRELISLDQLQQAMSHLKDENRPFGEIAIDMGLLTKADVEEILLEQISYKTMLTGQVAQFLGKLDEAQVEAVLARQRELNIQLGDALISLDLLDQSKLERELENFEATRTKF